LEGGSIFIVAGARIGCCCRFPRYGDLSGPYPFTSDDTMSAYIDAF
jgi:hypothetical protein